MNVKCGGVVVATVMACVFTTPVLAGTNCTNADPGLALAGIGGDYELTIDPVDNSVLYASNTADGAANIVVAKLDGATGVVVPGAAATVVANNYSGLSAYNGPEWVKKPTGELGLLYAGADGLHGVFRATSPAAWNAFDYDVFGNPTNGSPPVMPAIAPASGNYPKAQYEGQYTYGQRGGDVCVTACYGQMSPGAVSDVSVLAASLGLTATDSTPSPRDRTIYFTATDAAGGNALYEATIDNVGGYMPGSVTQIAVLDITVSDGLVAKRHPVTGTTVLFVAQNLSTGWKIYVFEQPAAGGPTTLLAQVPVPANTLHYRAEASDTQIVLAAIVFGGSQAGTYTLPVSAVDGALVVEPPAKISSVTHGTELIWMPAAQRWALYDNKKSDWTLRRCWVDP